MSAHLTQAQARALEMLHFEDGIWLHPQQGIRLDTWRCLILRGYIECQVTGRFYGQNIYCWFAGPQWTERQTERQAALESLQSARQKERTTT